MVSKIRLFMRTFFIISILLCLNYNAKACTTFCIHDSTNLIFGRNLDFEVGFGHAIINKRNINKTSMIQPPEKSIKWISKYGSITFNQGGREFPHGGINEKGLVIEQMWLDETKYPEIDERYGMSVFQWIQYQLDNSETVNEVIKSDTLIRISTLSSPPLHFLICDKDGNKATIEYINGEMVVHKESILPISVLANDTYKKSLEYLETKSDFGGEDTASYTSRSLDRFVNTASMIKKYDSENIIDYSFEILQSVQGEENQWNIVYDIKNMIVYYKTKDNLNRRSLKFSDVDFSCSSTSLYADIESDMINERVEFKEYSYQKNRALIDSVCNNVTFLQWMPEELREYSARYPETTNCNE
jgi:penicillin V acylase-like amidase (Ntn superfamily)